jgi:hypothetical protein
MKASDSCKIQAIAKSVYGNISRKPEPGFISIRMRIVNDYRGMIRTHLKNVFWPPAFGGIGASFFQDNWIPRRFYYIKGRRQRCWIPHLILYGLWVTNQGSAARVPATCPVEVLTKTEAFRRRRNLEPKSYF